MQILLQSSFDKGHLCHCRPRPPVQEIVEVLDSEDEELLKDSDYEPEPQTMPMVKSVTEVLEDFQKQTVTDDTVTKLLVQRSRMLETALKGLDRKSINFNSRLYIKFTGELGEDQGGPRREFFRLVMNELLESKFFEGPEDQKIFTHNLSLLETSQYRLVGRMVALSMAHNGPGLHFLAPELFALMTGEKVQLDNVDSLLTEELKSMIKQLRDADNDTKDDVFLSTYGDQLLDLGVPNVYRMARQDKNNLVELIKKHHIYYRLCGEISQFTLGMNDVNKAWDLVKSNAEVFKPMFCYKQKTITSEEMLELFKVNFSEPGSNAKALEDITVYGWECFLQSIEAGDIEVSFSDVLAFVTGASNIPPCGFSKKIDVDFYSCEGRLPSASTCSLNFWLPRVTDSDVISNMMLRAVKESCGFHKV